MPMINLYEIFKIYTELLLRLQVKRPHVYQMTLGDWLADQRNSRN